MSSKSNTYLVALTVIEGRHYIWDNMNSAVLVRVGNKKRSTAVQKCTDCPFYNELDCTYERLLEKNIVFTVIQPRTFCRRRKILGSVKLDVATVMNQKNAQFYHKWAILASPKADVVSGPTGYLKVDITVLSRGQTPKLPLNVVNDEIEGNLLTPMAFVGERQRAKFIFDVYRCEHLQLKNSQFVDTPPGRSPNALEPRPSSYIAITFAGSTVSTAVRKSTSNPVFNERLSITDLFPPLCQRVKIEICFDGFKKSVQASHHLNLKHISNDTVDGFLPTFGPTYIHLNTKDGYVGTLLLAIRTEFLDDSIASNAGQKTHVQQGVHALKEDSVFHFEQTFLYAAILEANCIWKKYHDKPISFRLTFGNIFSDVEVASGLGGDEGPQNASKAEKPWRSGKNFYYMNYRENKPCLKINSRRPDFRKRMFNSNMLEKISQKLKENLIQIEEMFAKSSLHAAQMIGDRLKETSDILFTSAKKYVEIITTSYNFNYGSLLDMERTKMCLRTMNGILDKLEMLQSNRSKKFVFRHLDDIQKKIESLIEDAQPCWPDVYIWMTCSNKKVAFLRIPAREIAFSLVDEEIGEHCGKIRPMLFMIDEKNLVLCKIEVLLWLGLDKQSNKCLEILPAGFKYDGKALIAEQKYLFTAKAHIFEGEVEPGFDESGLVDPFVQVFFERQMKQTQIKKNVLVPLWDQTLTFNSVCLYGTKEHIRQHPPHFLLQMFDDDPMSLELVGRVIIKPVVFLESSPEVPSSTTLKLAFHCLKNRGEVLGRLLAAFELTEMINVPFTPRFSKLEENLFLTNRTTTHVGDDQIVAIPAYLKPLIEPYRAEVLFWGVRNLKKVNLIRINRPKISFYCGNKSIESSVIENAKKFSNFVNPVNRMDMRMAGQFEYPEAFQFKLFDSRMFGVYVFGGINICETTPFLFTPLTVEGRRDLLTGIQYQSSSLIMKSVTSSEIFVDNWERALVKVQGESLNKQNTVNRFWKLFVNAVKKICATNKCKRPLQSGKSVYSLLSIEESDEDFSDFDWWTKFYASLEESPCNEKKEQIPSAYRNKLKVYPNELENQPEFKGFSDILTSFEIFKGKRTGDEILDEQLTTAIFKGNVKIYQWPPTDGDLEKYVTSSGALVKDGILSEFPLNTSVQYVLRVYCVRGINLRPKDLNGKSDPYIQIHYGQKVLSDRENYVPKEVNPIFGRCFEFYGSFPDITTVTVRILDYDMTSRDDLIGETKIDFENRFYTRHRAHCGIAEQYFTSGYCKWRDQKSPTEILKTICKKCGLSEPEFTAKSVCIENKQFIPKDFKTTDDPSVDQENLALEALRRWQEMPVVGYKLVPEYVETRSLFAPDKPGIEQGKIQLWIDVFPRLDYPVPEKVNVTPRKPVSYELRVVIWNTEDVVLAEDDFFSGEKKSDIYVKGWLDQPENTQFTDVHYRSLTGEGNFNWRFVFKFDYLATENKLVIRKKDSIFSRDESQLKTPCVLHLTVWDNDTFSADDFLGSIALELSRMPRGARSAKKCDLFILEPTNKRINLFKLRRTRGWWPFQATDHKTQKQTLGGKLEAELEILTKEDAEAHPVGMGRQGPEALPPPKLGDRIQHRHIYGQETSWFLGKSLRGWCQREHHVRCWKCGTKRKSRDCKIFFITFTLVALLFTIVLILYLKGYLTSLGPACSQEKKPF